MNTIGVLHNALRPMKVPVSLAAKVRDQVRQEIAGVPSAPPAETAPKGVLSQLKTAAQAFIRRAGELVVNINLGEMIGAGALQGRQPAEVYAYSVVEALDKAAQRRKARILMDAQGRFYEVPQSVLKRCTLSKGKSKRGRR